MFRVVAFVLLALAAVVRAYEPPAATREVTVLRYEWQDAKRDRAVPAKVYLPGGPGKWPVIVFSHGLGGSREAYEYLGRHWAGCGFVAVHLQHPGSDDSVWKNAPGAMPHAALKSAADARNALARPRDVSFAIDRLTALDAEAGSALHGRLNLQRIGVAGHSFGAHTAMLIAGQTIAGTDLADARVRCAVAMSAPAAAPRMRDQAYASVRMPVFHFTGTEDDSPIGDTRPADRRIPFDRTTSAEAALVIFQGGDHMIFSGRLADRPARAAQDATFQKLICLGTTAFWDAWLKDDAGARTWLMEGGFTRALGTAGTFETKRPAK